MAKFFKCTRPNGTDFRTGTISYAKALETGEPIELLDAAPANGNVCGHGLHVSDTPRKTIQFADRAMRPWRWFEVSVRKSDIVESDASKSRVKRLRVTKEITLADIFGPDFSVRIEAVGKEADTWKEIPWLKPKHPVGDDQLQSLFEQWHDAISPWLSGDRKLPRKAKVVRLRAAAAAADADAAAAAAAADAAAAAAADAAAADAAADAAAADADAAAAAAAADADAAKRILPWWLRWYVRPRYVLWRQARWSLAGMTQESPWTPLVEMFRLGALPIGYSGGEFVIYCPEKA